MAPQTTLPGLSYHQRLGVGFFGEVYRGHDGGEAVRIVHVDPRLGELAGFDAALAHGVKSLALLDDPRVVIARRVGRAPDGTLVVVTDAVKGALAVEDLMLRAGGALPPDVAVAIAHGVIEALGYAHSIKRTHGGVHPRSVLIDFHGAVRLADFALANALARVGPAAAPLLGKRAADYTAPELRGGSEPSVGGDVYAAGVLLAELLTGALPPVGAEVPRGIGALIARATAASPRERYLNGTELEEALDDAVLSDGQRVALESDVASYVTSILAKGEDELDAATENVLAEIGLGDVQPTLEPPRPVAPAPRAAPAARRASRPMTDLLAGLEDENVAPGIEEVGDPAVAADVAAANTGSIRLPPLPKPRTRPGFEYRSDSELQAELAADAAAQAGPGTAAGGTRQSRRLEPTPAPQEPEPPPERTPSPNVRPRSRLELEARLRVDDSEAGGFDDNPTTGEHTHVQRESSEGERERDALSQLIHDTPDAASSPVVPAFEDEDTPLPAPRAYDEEDGSVTADLEAVVASRRANTQMRREDESHAMRAIDSLGGLDDGDEPSERTVRERPPPRPASAAPRAPSPRAAPPPPAAPPPRPAASRPASLGLSQLALEDELLGLGRKKGRSGLFWAGVSVFALASLFGILYARTDLFHPGRAQAEAEIAERERAAKQAELEKAKVVAGEVVVDSPEPEAAVWLLLGRTPADSFRLPASKVHELRLEYEGYLPLDLPVTATHWTEKAGQLRAEVRAKLVPGDPRTPVPPYPPEPATPHAAGADGVGTIHVESTPPGAQVWMLIGFTPEVKLSGIPAGEHYEFKILKTGFRPGFAVVKPDDWYLAGPDSPVKPNQTRSVELTAIPPEPKPGKKHR